MTKVSASTLARQAAKTKNPALAKKLRAQAAKIRRDARSAKAPDPVLEARAIRHRRDMVVAARAASPDSWSLTPGHGEIVGGKLARKADEITKLARGKHGADAVQKELSGLEHRARSVGYADGTTSNDKAWRHAMISSFIASADAIEKANGGRFPPTMVVPGLTLSCLAYALREAGFSEFGAHAPDGL